MPQVIKKYSHSLGAEEAGRRIREAIEKEKIVHKNAVTNVRENWLDDRHLDFALKAFGFDISGSLEITENEILVKMTLPFVAMMVKGMIERQMDQEVEKLLT